MPNFIKYIVSLDTSYPELKIYYLEWKTGDGLRLNETRFEINTKKNKDISLKLKWLKNTRENYACYAYASTGIVRQTIEIKKLSNSYEFNVKKPKPKSIELKIEGNRMSSKYLMLNQSYNFECVTGNI